MAVPLLVVASLASRIYKVLNLGSKTNVIVGGSGIASVLAYLGHEIAEPDPFADSTLLTSKPKTKPIPNPTVKIPITAVVDNLKSNSLQSSQNSTDLKQSLASTGASISDHVANLVTSAEDSPLLINQVALVDALHSISMGIEAQAIVLSSIFETLDSNLSGLVALASINAQNFKVQGDYQKQSAINSDYGDADFFYSFVPTSQYWHEVDVAVADYNMQQYGSLEFMFSIPSDSYAGSEIALIDSMQADYDKSEIRKAVEAYRVSHVDANIRAHLGVSLIASQASSAENTKAQTDYYKASTSAIPNRESLARENIDAVKAVATATLEAGASTGTALGSLGSVAETHLASIAEYAVSAKVLTDYAQTAKTVTDLHGVPLAVVKPMELATMKDGAIALEKADINSIGAEHIGEMEDILDGVDFDAFKFMNFISVAEHLVHCTPEAGDFDWSRLNG